MSAIYSIEHRIADGSNFNGAAPSLGGSPLEPADGFGIRVFGEGDAGGLFEFPFATNQVSWVVERVLIDMTISGYTINLVDTDNSITVELDTGSSDVLLMPGWVLGPMEQLSLTTSGGSGVGIARVLARPMIPLSV